MRQGLTRMLRYSSDQWRRSAEMLAVQAGCANATNSGNWISANKILLIYCAAKLCGEEHAVGFPLQPWQSN
jgi:hypothetical protein